MNDWLEMDIGQGKLRVGLASNPCLFPQEHGEPFEFHFDQVIPPQAFEKIEQGVNKKAAVGPKENNGNHRRQGNCGLLDELANAVCRIS